MSPEWLMRTWQIPVCEAMNVSKLVVWIIRRNSLRHPSSRSGRFCELAFRFVFCISLIDWQVMFPVAQGIHQAWSTTDG